MFVLEADVQSMRRGIRNTHIRVMAAVVISLLLVLLSGCRATLQSRKSLEDVAKNWCETIRASQIICVYPLTEDLQPGDVFMVQVPIKDQADLYRRKGFLALDDQRTRMDVDYKKMYFDGYWKDEFGSTPHPRPSRKAGVLAGETSKPPKIEKTDIAAPRASFPTYRFEATSSGGISLAIPIQGVPLGLGYLASDKVIGTVTIADVRTYAGNSESLYTALESWVQKPSVRQMLNDTLRQTGDEFLILRVISRVYLTGGVVVSLDKGTSQGAQAQAGAAQPPKQSTFSTTTETAQEAVVSKLNEQAKKLSEVLPGTGAVRFASASASTVALSESFDRPLVIGYLGFDVPVYRGGVLGAPIPTYERLEGIMAESPFRAYELSIEQARFKIEEHALEALAEKNLAQALKVARLVTEDLNSAEFSTAREKIKSAEEAMRNDRNDWKFLAQEALHAYKMAAEGYVAASKQRGPRYGRYSDAFSIAYDRRDE